MADEIQQQPSEPAHTDVSLPAPYFPSWLMKRFLREDEGIEWVYGPALKPWWERYACHPVFIATAVVVAALWLAMGWVKAGDFAKLSIIPVLGPAALVVGSIFIVGASCGYFTRLVITNHRLLIVQGYELCRQWRVDDLPPWLIRYRRLPGADVTKTVDLDALRTMIGSSSANVADAKTILALGKHLANIRGPDDRRR